MLNRLSYAADDVSADDKLLLDECVKAHLRLEEAYSNLSMKIKTNSIYVKKDLKTKSDLSYWRRSDGYYRLDVDGLEPPREPIITLIIPKGVMSFQKKPDDSYRLLTHGSADATQEGTTGLNSLGFYSAPFSFKGLPRDVWFDVDGPEPDRHIKIFQEMHNDVKTVVLQIDYPFNNELRTVSRYRFDRDNMWVMLEGFMLGVDRQGKPSTHMKTTCEYDGVVDGVPRLKKYVSASYSPDGTLKQSQTFDVAELTFGAPPLSIFDTEQFLPKHGLLQRESMTWGRIIMMSIGLLLIFIGLFSKMRQSRSGSKT